MEELYGPFIESRGLPREVAEYLWNDGFTSIDSLRLLPMGDLKELPEILPQCPNIHQTAVKLAIRRIVSDLNNGRAPPPLRPPLQPRPTPPPRPAPPVRTSSPPPPRPPHPTPAPRQTLAEQPPRPHSPQPSTDPKPVEPLPKSIAIPLIDNQCQIGQLYNFETSQLLSHISWSDDDIKNNVATEKLSNEPTISAHDISTVSGQLNVLELQGNASVRLNVLLGAAGRNEAVQKIMDLDCNPINSDCYCIRFSSRIEQRTVEHLRVDHACGGATHVVTGITYGFDQYFVFIGESGTLKSRIERLVDALNAPSVSNMYPLTEEGTETCCNCFGDDEARTLNMFDAYHELRRYRNGSKQVVVRPKTIFVRPLPNEQFTDVSHNVTERIERVYGRFEEMKGSILSILSDTQSSVLSNRLLNVAKTSASEMKGKMIEFFTGIIGDYREQLDESNLLKELEKAESAFENEGLKEIMQIIHNYCTSAKDALSQLNNAGIPIIPEDVQPHVPTLVLSISLHPVVVAISHSIFVLFDDKSEGKRHSQNVAASAGFHDNLRRNIDAFINFHRTNGTKISFTCCVADSTAADLVCVQYYRSKSDPMEIVTIPTPIHAETIVPTDIGPTSIQLQWKTFDQCDESLADARDNHHKSLLIGYRITVINVSENKTDFQNSHEQCEECVVTGLAENTDYEFRIRPLCRDGMSMEDSPSSHQFRTRQTERLAHRVRRMAKLIPNQPVPTYRLERRTIKHDGQHTFSQYAIGKETSGQVGEKLLLLSGGTGSGKSTLVNAIVNYLYDVRLDDEFRLKLITDQDEYEESKTTQAGSSKTKRVSAYQLNGTRLPYRLTIVDTPGFGDTEGLDIDRTNAEHIRDWFNAGALGEQKLIDAVCLVMKSSETRVTPQVKHELVSVINLFTRDMEPNILTLFTFCDGGSVNALGALKAQNIPLNAHFEFNNHAFFSNLKGDEMQRIFWRRANQNYEKFFDHLNQLQPRSLALALHALHVREKIELQAHNLQERIREEMELLHTMTNLFQLVDQHRMEIAKNQHFRTVQKVRQPREIQLKEGVLATTCLNCNYTCHKQCNIRDNNSLHWCSIMGTVIPPKDEQLKKGGKGYDGAVKFTFQPTPEQDAAQRRDARCTVCPPRCHWSKHVNKNSMIVYEDVMREITDENIYKRYAVAVNEANRTEKVVAQMTDQFIAMEQQLIHTVTDIRKLLNELDQIALRPGQMTDSEYIKMMIETEKADMKDGYQHRLEVLHRHLSMIEMIGQAQRGDNMIDRQVENKAFEFLRTRFPDLYANISNARQFRAQQPATPAIAPGLYPCLSALSLSG